MFLISRTLKYKQLAEQSFVLGNFAFIYAIILASLPLMLFISAARRLSLSCEVVHGAINTPQLTKHCGQFRGRKQNNPSSRNEYRIMAKFCLSLRILKKFGCCFLIHSYNNKGLICPFLLCISLFKCHTRTHTRTTLRKGKLFSRCCPLLV